MFAKMSSVRWEYAFLVAFALSAALSPVSATAAIVFLTIDILLLCGMMLTWR